MLELADFHIGRFGLGQVVGATPQKRLADTEADQSIRDFLRHDLVAERPTSALPFPQLRDVGQARAYAARAFHIAVDSGLSRSGTPQLLWAKSAAVYFFAWQDVKAGITNLKHVLEFLKYANELASDAYNTGGGKLPDPQAPKAPSVKVAPEDRPMETKKSNFLLYGAIAGGAAGLLYLVTRKKR